MQPTPATADWWDIGSFWVALTALGVSLLIGIIAVWVTYRVSYPRRRLVVLHNHPEPLTGSSWSGRPVLRDGWRRIGDPHLIELGVGNDGRQPIPGDLFDMERPFIIDMGAPIAFIRHDTKQVPRRGKLRHTEPSLSPGVQVHGNEIQIGPGMLAALQLVDIHVVVDGRPTVTYRNPLVGVPRADADVIRRSRTRFERAWRFVTLAVAAVAIVPPLILRLPAPAAAPMVIAGLALMALSGASLWAGKLVIGHTLRIR